MAEIGVSIPERIIEGRIKVNTNTRDCCGLLAKAEIARPKLTMLMLNKDSIKVVKF